MSPTTGEEHAQIGLRTWREERAEPPPCRYVFHLTNFRDPIGQGDLRKTCRDGREQAVRAWIKIDERIAAIIHQCRLLAAVHVGAEGNTFLTIGFADRHGKWISPAVAELVSEAMGKEYRINVVHYDV